MKSGLRAVRFAVLAGTMGVAMTGAMAGTPEIKGPVSSSGSVGDAADMFGMRPAISDAALSPDGTKLLYLTADRATGTQLMVAAVDGSAPAKSVTASDGHPMQLRWCDWADNNRIVCSATGSDTMNGDLVGFQRLLSVNSANGELKLLSQQGADDKRLRMSQFDGNIIDWLQGEQGRLLMMRDHVPEETIGTRLGKSANGLGVDLVDVRTLSATKVEQADPSAESFISDGKGVVRLMAARREAAGGMMGDTQHWYYRRAGSRVWESFSTVTKDDKGLRPLSVDPATDSVYCLVTANGRDALFRVSLDGSMKTELVVSDPHVDVDNVVRLGRQARLIGASTAGDTGRVIYFDPAYRQLAEALSRALPGLPQISFLSSSDDESKILLSAGSDVDPGRYFVFDKTTKHLNEIALARPQLEHVTLAPMKAIIFRASDGTMVPGYLTLPPSGQGKGLPAIVMPHGGPASHDDWGFDWLVQFFAHQGYAVLQPEYRGSTGYGDAWMLRNGFQSWRIAIGDVLDAGRWLVSQGIAAPDKLAIVGWSYGGYAALQSNVVDPNLFKAIVAIAPVTDLDALRLEARGFTNAALVSDYIGHGDNVAAGSPARHAEAFKAPVLMFHGTADQNVRVAESRLMNDRLHAAGKTSTVVVYPDLDHQLPSGEIRADMLRRADLFLRQSMHMPTG